MSNVRRQSVDPGSTSASALIPSHYWIIGPREDLLLFLGTPVLLLTLVAVAQTFWNLTALSVFATILAMGHYLPGLMRAYGDPALFQRFKIRFLVAPIILIGAALASSTAEHESNVFFMVVVIWGAWHWLMQTYGLVRIYDAKAKNFDSTSARLDYALCISWFGVIYWYTDGASSVLMRFYQAGGDFAPHFVRVLAWAWLAGTVIITAVYVVHTIRRWRAGHPPSQLKLALLVVTAAFYLYAFGFASSRIVAFMLFEGYHDIQYLAIVWVFNRNRAAKDRNAGAFTRFLFRQRTGLIVLYIALCIGFGSYDYVARHMISEVELAKLAVGLITGFALVHFYFDGFIWRIREPETRATLGVDSDSQAPQMRLPPQLRHALIWALFLIPLFILAYWEQETRAGTSEAEVLQEVIKARPASHKAHYQLGKKLLGDGHIDEALVHAIKSRELRPGYDLYEMLYADVMLARGELSSDELDDVIKSYEMASATRPTVADLFGNWATALSRCGQLDDALVNYQKALELNPGNAELHFKYAGILARQNKLNEAIQACQKAIRHDPALADAYSLLGMCLMARQQPQFAFEQFRTALKHNPNQVNVLTNFAMGLVTVADLKLRDFDEAITLAEQARDLTKNQDPGVLNCLATVYAVAGRSKDAQRVAQRAADLYTAAGQQQRAQQLMDAISKIPDP